MADNVVSATTAVVDGINGYWVWLPGVVVANVFVVFRSGDNFIINCLKRSVCCGRLKRKIVCGVSRKSFCLNTEAFSIQLCVIVKS
jgi:hypothetical protein